MTRYADWADGLRLRLSSEKFHALPVASLPIDIIQISVVSVRIFNGPAVRSAPDK